MIELKREDVAKKYECPLENDITIHANGYSGKISNVNLSGAEHLVKSKTGYLVEKPITTQEASELDSTTV